MNLTICIFAMLFGLLYLATGTASGIPASYGTEEHRREDSEVILSSAAEIDEVCMAAELEHVGRMTREETVVPILGEEVGPNLSSSATMDVQEIHMVDELEHPFILSGEKESPFTYLASLSAMLAAMKDDVSKVQGKIKVCLHFVHSLLELIFDTVAPGHYIHLVVPTTFFWLKLPFDCEILF